MKCKFCGKNIYECYDKGKLCYREVTIDGSIYHDCFETKEEIKLRKELEKENKKIK